MWSSAACILTSTRSSIRFPCALRSRIALYLDARKRARGVAADGVWQIDRHVNALNYWQMQECLERSVRRGKCPLLQLVAKELGTPAARGAKNGIPDQDQQGIQTTAAIGQESLLHRIAIEHKLNDSQRAALATVPGHHITLIQGPPGTGKTSLAAALLCFMRELHQGRSLAAAPSNAAADNIARRIRPYQLKAGRHGHRAARDLA